MLGNTYRFVPTFNFTKNQRPEEECPKERPSTLGLDQARSGENELPRSNTSSRFECESRFSKPSPVTSGLDQPYKLLFSPTEQSPSSSHDDSSVKQQRKALHGLFDVHTHDQEDFVKAHGKEVESHNDDIEEVEALHQSQKTWGPRRRSSSCPTYLASLFHEKGIQQESMLKEPPSPKYQNIQQQETKVRGNTIVVNDIDDLHQPEHQELKEPPCQGDSSKSEEEKRQFVSQEHGIGGTPVTNEEKSCVELCAPVECTSPRIVMTNGTRKSTVRCFDGFRDMDVYKNRHGSDSYVNIFSTEEAVHKIDFKALKRVGSGGNGTVYSYDEFAVKETRYRKAPLNVVCKLNHPNLIELQGVTLSKCHSDLCYHIMPLMTYDLNRGLHSVGPLERLARESDDDTWMTVESNVRYLMKETLKGLTYMEECYIQHGDIKEKNLLIEKICQCSDILHCLCPDTREDKYAVKIADYDYIRQTKLYREPVNLLYCANLVTSKYSGGTLLYRAPEESKRGTYKGYSGRLGGPCSDVYSFGVLMLKVCLGPNTWRDFHNANIVVGQPGVSKPNVECETSIIREMLMKLLNAARRCRRLDFLVDIVRDCLEVNPSRRATASELLKRML